MIVHRCDALAAWRKDLARSEMDDEMYGVIAVQCVPSEPAFQQAVASIVSAIGSRLSSVGGTLVVALDGGSGAGKTTLACEVAKRLGATVIQCDDFFSATVTDAEWDSYTPDQKCQRCIDWQRMRDEVLEPLLAGRVVQYHPYSSDTGDGLSTHWVRKEPAQVILPMASTVPTRVYWISFIWLY
ncbi:MAG: uridine kinase family protein [Bacillota bacterium]